MKKILSLTLICTLILICSKGISQTYTVSPTSTVSPTIEIAPLKTSTGTTFEDKKVKAGAIILYQYVGPSGLGSPRLLNRNYFFQVTNVTQTINGINYHLILIPSTKIKNTEAGTTKITQINAEDFGRSFWISDDDMINNCEKLPTVSKWDLYLATIPFKYRWSYKGGPSAFTGESTLGPTVSYRISKDDFENTLNLVGGIGLTFLNKSLLTDSTNTNKNSFLTALTVHFGISFNIKNVGLNILYGYDFTDDNYEYNKKPWISVGVSGKLSTIAYGKGHDNTK